MKPSRQTMECAGSLTPELEGAARSLPHPVRAKPTQSGSENKKGGK